jgi:hypothetical protein
MQSLTFWTFSTFLFSNKKITVGIVRLRTQATEFSFSRRLKETVPMGRTTLRVGTCSSVGAHRRLVGTYRLHLQTRRI